MKLASSVVLSMCMVIGGCATHKVPPPAADQPFNVGDTPTWEYFVKLTEPYVQQARRTYPDAKSRYLAGLPPGHSFSVTARLVDRAGKTEQVFGDVRKIEDGIITGVIANQPNLVQGFQYGDEYRLAEPDLIDWTIVRPDGTEEGNVVGRFLDEWQAQHR